MGGTIEWAKNEINNLPKTKKDLGPLLDALGQPLTQIVGGVGMLVAGVLNLLGNIVSLNAKYLPLFALADVHVALGPRP